MGAFRSGGVIVNTKNRSVVIGSAVIEFHPKMKGHRVKIVNSKCYIDGYAYVNGKWKKTFWATWYKLF